MMKIEDQVCTVDQGKKLLALGIDNCSYFCWIGDDNPDPKYYSTYKIYTDWEGRTEVGSSWYEARVPAFSVAELGLMLPPFPSLNWETYYEYEGGDRFVFCRSQLMGNAFGAYRCEARARAALLIELLENKKITADDVNRRTSLPEEREAIVAVKGLRVIHLKSGLQATIDTVCDNQMIIAHFDNTDDIWGDGLATTARGYKTLEGAPIVHPNQPTN